MKCTHCNAELPDNARFCTECGAPVSAPTPAPDQTAASAQTPPPASAPTPFHTSPAPNFDSTAAYASAATGASGAAKAGGALASKHKVAVLAAALAALVIIAIVYVLTSGTLTMGQTPATFETGFENDSIVTQGIASDAYVYDSPYQVTSFKAENIQKVDDWKVTADITATIENDNFKTDIQAKGTYYDATKSSNALAQELLTQGYAFDVVSSTTTPKKGIDYDKANGLDGVSAPLSDDGTSCTVEVDKANSFWFADSDIDTTYSYTFDGTQWKISGNQTTENYTYKKDIEGDYTSKVNASKLSKFTISNLDTEKGTFQIDYALEHSGSGNPVSISGTMNATIDPRETMASTDEQADGKSYYFEGTGTSSSGDGQAKISGFFTTSPSGESSIELNDLAADYTFSTSYVQNGMSSTEYFSNTLFKK